MKKIVLIGDSIRMGYQEAVKKAVGRRAEVLFPAENCGNSMRVRENLQAWAIAHQPDVIHFNCGIHDLGWLSGETVPRFSIGEYARSLRIIVDRLQKETRARLIFATTTPFLKPCVLSVPREKTVSAPVVARYNRAALRVMKQRRVPVNDLNAVIRKAGVYECLSEDRIHMTPAAYKLLAAAVTRAVLKAL